MNASTAAVPSAGWRTSTFASSSTPAGCRRSVWWAIWAGVDGPVAEQEQVTLDSQHSAHRYLRSLEKVVVGFRWSWPETGS